MQSLPIESDICPLCEGRGHYGEPPYELACGCRRIPRDPDELVALTHDEIDEERP